MWKVETLFQGQGVCYCAGASGRKKFRNNEEVIQDVQEWLHWQPKDFFLSGIHKLPDRWRKCIANQGDYVEE